MNLLNFLTNDYPCSLWQVRQANPNVSFPAEPSDEDLAPFGYINVQPTPQPSHNQRTERVEDVTREVDADGICRQQWEIRPATADEIAAYDIANAPQPDWMAFGIDLATHPGISALWEALPGPVSGALPTALNEAGKGDPRLFTGLWQRILATGAITPELLGAIAALAAQHYLPAAFIAGLAPATPDVDEAWEN